MFNSATLVGNLGKDPEIKSVGSSGDKVANFSIATSETWKDKAGQKQEKTVWHNIVCWRGLAEIVEKYVKKGDRVLIVGRIDNRSYDKPDGSKGYVSEIVADTLKMLGGKKDGDSGSSGGGAPSHDDSDPLPF